MPSRTLLIKATVITVALSLTTLYAGDEHNHNHAGHDHSAHGHSHETLQKGISNTAVKKIAIKEIKRLARNYVLLCEFHSKSWYNRASLKINSGYNAYNWVKLLKKHGFRDIATHKISEKDWPGGNPQKTFGYLILAKVPKI